MRICEGRGARVCACVWYGVAVIVGPVGQSLLSTFLFTQGVCVCGLTWYVGVQRDMVRVRLVRDGWFARTRACVCACVCVCVYVCVCVCASARSRAVL